MALVMLGSGCSSGKEELRQQESFVNITSETTMQTVQTESTEIKEELGDMDTTCKDIPEDYLKSNEKGGEIVSVKYETKFYGRESEKFEKTALVYLPYGYNQADTDKKYNVFYFLHGGSDNETWYFGGGDKENRLKNLLDNMIANGDMEPCIVCTPSYQNKFSSSESISCKFFHNELINDLIPAIEMTYNTYTVDTTEEGLNSTREHRAFGGFSMGSAATWWTFASRLKEIAYFMPVSGDSWCIIERGGATRTRETVNHLKNSVDLALVDNFYIFSGTGTKDIAYPNLKPQIEEMYKETETFKYSDTPANGNLYFCLYDGGVHNINTIVRIVYNGLPNFFK